MAGSDIIRFRQIACWVICLLGICACAAAYYTVLWHSQGELTRAGMEFDLHKVLMQPHETPPFTAVVRSRNLSGLPHSVSAIHMTLRDDREIIATQGEGAVPVNRRIDGDEWAYFEVPLQPASHLRDREDLISVQQRTQVSWIASGLLQIEIPRRRDIIRLEYRMEGD